MRSPSACSVSTATLRCRSSRAGGSGHGLAATPARRAGKQVVYFHGCGTEYYEPDGGEKVVAVLEHNGYRVEIPEQDCCGLPLQSSGLFEDARKYVLRLARPSRRMHATAR